MAPKKAEPPSKKAKTDAEPEKGEEAKDTAEETPAEEPKETGPPPELEKDAPAAKGPKIKDAAAFYTPDSTMNCIFSGYGNILMPLTDGGLQFLLAGARSNVGIKGGRYLFEAKVIELMSPAEDAVARTKSPLPRNQLRVGVSTAGASLFLGDSEDSVCFDMEGALHHNKKKEACAQKFGQGDIVSFLLNLDSSSPNANTISLFKNGVRACQPQPLPESLKGKELFPAFTFRNLSVHYNFGPKPLMPLPFTCHMLKDALTKDATVKPAPEKMKDGKQEAVFPVCLPEEGPFDWLDHYLQSNKQYTELSDRAIIAWAEKSGFAPSKVTRTSNDKPEMGFGIPMMDDGSVRRVLHAVAPIQQRNYIVMEVKSNLLKEERKELLAKWGAAGFKRTAAVMMGEPPAAFRKYTQEKALKVKQDASDADFRTKKAEEKRKKALEKRQKQIERERKKAAKLTKKKQEALKKKLEDEKKRKERAAKGEPEEEESKPEEEEEKESEEEKEDEEMEEPEEDPPKVEMTAEEKKAFFRKMPVPDLSGYTLSTSFQKFSVPEEEEGFDQVRYEWSKGDKCKEYLRTWVRDRKLTTRVEDLEPSEWFNNRWKDWQKALQAWHAKQNMHKAAVAKKAAEAAAKEAKKRAEAEKKAKEAKDKEAKGETAEEAEKEPEKEEKEEEKEEPAVDFANLDVFGVDNVLDVGGGQPLFYLFAYEDWTMLSLRFEIHLLTHAFRRDVNDADRAQIILEHLPFYYQKYFKKALNTKMFGVESVKEILGLIKDTVIVSGKNSVVQSMLPDDLESFGVFAMITEEARRYRTRRVTMGDESAALKVTQQQVAVAALAGNPRPVHTVVPGPRPVAGAVAAMSAAVRPGVTGWSARPPAFANGAGVGPAARPWGGAW
eukprot:CAMPEP_0171179032 /NCGR_PEP_ID=MMETSP0790-20130122/13051_1 /TAXON_ID=2925 /ORGANISM="Alexandrium catenella, Strain OF101" /LENGTH=889 /DNA_ID=CAMNT_0011643959 /DNA_START=48 /DNA_END=2714 /DNA_ORIENTATION=+